jgi:hypothetical protein
MFPKIYPGLIFYFLLIQWTAVGQSISLLHKTHYGQYTFGIKHKGSDILRSGNSVVKQIALQLTKSPDKTQYYVDYSYRLSSCKFEKGIWKIGFILKIDKITGDISVNGFDISDELKPGLVSFEARIIDEDGGIMNSSSFSNIIPGKDTTLIFSPQANSTLDLQPEDLELNGIVFGYDEKGLEKNAGLFKSIKIYEAASMLAEFSQKQADYLNRQVINPSPEILLQIVELSEAVRLLAQLQNQWGNLKGNANSDLLHSEQRILAYRVHFIQQLFIRNAATATVKKSRMNIYGISRDWVIWQVHQFTDQEKPEFSRLVFYQLGKASYQPSDLVFLRKAISVILNTNQSLSTPVACYWALGDAVTKAYLREGKKLTASGYYTEAADLLQSAARMCNSIPYATSSDQVYQQQSVALYGTYHSYLNISRKAINANRPALALKYAELASNFQILNSHYIITDLEIKKLFTEVNFAMQLSGNIKVKSNNPAVAKTYFPDVKSDVKSENNSQLNKPGVTGTNEDMLQIALTDIQKYLDEVNSALAVHDCEHAFNLLDNVKQLMIEYSISEDNPLIETAENYWNEADSCVCAKNEAECKRLVISIGLSSANHDFISASDECTKALALAKQNSACKFNSQQFEAMLSLYRRPTEYQRMIGQVDSLLNTNTTGTAIELYSEAGQFFTQYKLTELGLVYLPIPEFAAKKHNCELYASSINYLLNQNEIEESLTLLSRMEADNFPAERCKVSQEKVAEKIALRDSLENKPVQFRQRLLVYTGGSVWYNHFKEAYMKALHL